LSHNSLLPHIEISTGSTPSASVIWLHGLGADGHDFEPIVGELNLRNSLAARFIFPHAPNLPVTLNGGYVMPAWYDIAYPDLTLGEDEAGIRDSQQKVEQLIRREIERGIPASHIVLAGFSQGGAMALQTGLRYRDKLAGILALSTYLPLKSTLPEERSIANLDIPIFMAHGTLDTVIPPKSALSSRDFLENLGYKVEWHEYPMAHSICPEEVNDIGKWLGQVLG